jgi:hypothetical protein
MTVRCPRCGTLYRRPPGRRGSDTSFRCARCRHVFAVEAEEPAVVAEEAADDPGDDDDERFTFDDDPQTEPDLRGDDDAEPDAETEEPPPAPAGKRVVTPARFALRSLLGITLVYAALSVYIYTHPETARDALARVPFLGVALMETRLSPSSIQLTNVAGVYQRVKGDRLVFVVSGTALNNSPMPVKGVQVEGRIVGAREERQVVFCGAAPHEIGELSVREIALLQSLEPPKEWALGPGEQADFLVAFTEPPVDLREFSARVVGVQAPARRAG